MQKIQQGAALCFAVLSAFVVWQSWSLEYYTTLGPGAGFFPLWLGVSMGGLSLVWLIQTSASKKWPTAAAFLPKREGVVRILSVLAALVAVTILIDFIGFQIAMFLFLFFILRIPGKQTLWMTLIIALLGSGGVYHVFWRYLDVQLPASSFVLLAKLGL